MEWGRLQRECAVVVRKRRKLLVMRGDEERRELRRGGWRMRVAEEGVVVVVGEAEVREAESGENVAEVGVGDVSVSCCVDKVLALAEVGCPDADLEDFILRGDPGPVLETTCTGAPTPQEEAKLNPEAEAKMLTPSCSSIRWEEKMDAAESRTEVLRVPGVRLFCAGYAVCCALFVDVFTFGESKIAVEAMPAGESLNHGVLGFDGEEAENGDLRSGKEEVGVGGVADVGVLDMGSIDRLPEAPGEEVIM
ncbi:hypothetical protein BDQ17DRAFT_1333685 [Cyathus striatus]|nr:hypothetical protein BDQ17DRAFT_1333685 [Cyathus striatus]